MATRIGIVVKIGLFSLKNGDEIEARRQKRKFFTQIRRRELISSPKTSIFHLKTVTRLRLVAKNKHFSLKNGDEIEARRQNRAFPTSKW
ncbi:hypothetical protein LIZ76_11710 [Caldibacillus sp. 210928-DFI.2.22]|uniref:hypothetical protein n=1 Tax=unclassified Caldibacillus TaxID=2641266 RepID=UPI001D07CF28|nr:MULTISPECIES: hypothetical protein [unclassified Caldibacillus]MCB7070637.1 hypothetical protein [Caldibacillus sp. 210928-DFI.2.22]MCB7074197.1 hypothetical protein [Caldibacillus sp. 210928-DFI.2.18]